MIRSEPHHSVPHRQFNIYVVSPTLDHEFEGGELTTTATRTRDWIASCKLRISSSLRLPHLTMGGAVGMISRLSLRENLTSGKLYFQQDFLVCTPTRSTPRRRLHADPASPRVNPSLGHRSGHHSDSFWKRDPVATMVADTFEQTSTDSPPGSRALDSSRESDADSVASWLGFENIVSSGSSRSVQSDLLFDVSFLEYTKFYRITQRQEHRKHNSRDRVGLGSVRPV